MDRIELGDKVEDKASEFSGIVVAISTYLNGDDRIGVQPPSVNKETGGLSDAVWFDRNRLNIVQKSAVK